MNLKNMGKKPNSNLALERTPNFYNGRTDARTDSQTGVTLNAPPPFFEWRGHKNNNSMSHKLNPVKGVKVIELKALSSSP